MTGKSNEQLLAEVAAAEARRDAAAARWDAYSGNNPHPPALKACEEAADARARAVEAAKAAGAMPRTDAVRLAIALDATFPTARSNEIVVYEGQRYKRKFTPTGNKHRPWDRCWDPMGPAEH